MNRRKFIKTGAILMTSTVLPWETIFANEDKSVVWEIEGQPKPAVDKLFEALGGLKSMLSKEPEKSTVLLKPNLCLPHPTPMGTTTSPELVDALCAHLLANGVKKIIIADHTLQKSAQFSKHGILTVAEKYPQVKVVLANEQRLFQPVAVEGKVLKQVERLKMLPKIDLLINLPTAKNHSAAQVSLATKNLMGLIWDRSIFHTQLDLGQAIGDLALTIRPQLNIIDTSRVLLNGGPTGPGPVITENRLFAGTDILAVDAVVTSRYNFGGKSVSPKEIPHLWMAYQNGVGEIDLNKIKVEKATV